MREYDAVFVQKRLFSLPWIFAARLAAKRLIFDFDDAIWTSPTGNWSRMTRAKTRLRLRTMIAKADCVIAGNSYLADYARQYRRNVRVIPTCIDTDHYSPQEGDPHDRLTIGWIGSKPNIPYLAGLEPAFSGLPNADLSVISDKEYKSPNLPTDFTRWSAEGELAALRSFDIGVMPLADDEWACGKCGFKILQYMACGIPAVVSPVGVNREIIADSVNGFLAASTDEWVERLTALSSDASLRTRIAAAGRSTVLANYSAEIGKKLLLETLWEVCAP
jgi:glycosyltransferase involved in cell wall biosynthesis